MRLDARHAAIGGFGLSSLLFFAMSLACVGETGELPPDVLPDDPPPQDALEDPSPSKESGPWVRIVPNTPPGPFVVGDDVLRSQCQPEVFVPDEVEIEADPSNPPYSRIVGDTSDRERAVWAKPWSTDLSPPDGMTLDTWTFTCHPHYEDHVLEIRQDGERKALFTHIQVMSSAPDGRRLYMVNLVKTGDDWVRKARILDLHSMEAIELAPADCVGWAIDWAQGGLLTLGSNPEWSDTQDMCLWSDAGEQLGHVQFDCPGNQLSHAAGVASVRPPLLFAGDRLNCRAALVDVERGIIRVDDDLDDDARCISAAGVAPMDRQAFDAFGELLSD